MKRNLFILLILIVITLSIDVEGRYQVPKDIKDQVYRITSRDIPRICIVKGSNHE